MTRGEPADAPPAAPPRQLSPREITFWFGASGAPPALDPKASPEPPVRGPVARVAAEYRLGPGDLLEFRIPEEPAHDREVTVSPDGTIVLDLIGSVKVSGRQIDSLTTLLAKRYERFLINAHPLIALKRAREAEVDQVVVMGNVARTGRVDLDGQASLLDVLAGVGYGNKSEHLDDQITVVRRGRSLTLPARELLVPVDPRWNLPLQPDDVVVVHLPEQVSVVGEVSRPGPITLPAVGSITLVHALSLAGGFSETADMEHARLVRADGRASWVDLNPILYGGGEEPAPLRVGDTLTIPAGKATAVYVFGMVDSPGMQRYAGRVSLAQAVAHANPKQFGAVLTDAKLVRGWPAEPEVITLNLEALLFDRDAAQDVELMNGDVVYVPESLASDVLDAVTRAMSPLSGPINTAGQVAIQGN